MSEKTHVIELWSRLKGHLIDEEYTAAGMLPTRAPIGKGFFPVSTGMWDSPPNTSHRRLLFWGQDFGTVEYDSYNGETNRVPTWRNLESLLRDAGLDARSCIFSNVIMGRRPGATSTGASPAFKNPSFIKKCAAFLTIQLAAVGPEAIVVMGLHALRVLRQVEGNDIPKAATFKEWDKKREPTLLEARIGRWEGPLAVIVHPSFRPWNIKLRSPNGDPAEGHRNEVTLLRRLLAT